MKYVIFLGDGMADRPLSVLNGQTPLQRAVKPRMDRMAQEGFAGLVRPVPLGMEVGSDTANMAVMGYDPTRYYTGRSPLEAVGMSINLQPEDLALRCNLVTLSEPDASGSFASRRMIDYSADEIGSDEAARLVQTINKHLAMAKDAAALHLYPGRSYRHCLVWQHGPMTMCLTPPHDILTQQIGDWLPQGPGSELLLTQMEQSITWLSDHPVNQARIRRGLRPANAVWFWGAGTRPELPNLVRAFGLNGVCITAVDLVYGLGICAGLTPVDVPGATGNIHTNFRGKGEAAIRELAAGRNYVFLHVEAPDECGHRAEVENKIRSIEIIDSDIIAPIWTYLEEHRQQTGEHYRLLLLPDHPTPIELRTHAPEPVPFAVWSSDGRDKNPAAAYDEISCSRTGYLLEPGYRLFEQFIRTGFHA